MIRRCWSAWELWQGAGTDLTGSKGSTSRMPQERVNKVVGRLVKSRFLMAMDQTTHKLG